MDVSLDSFYRVDFGCVFDLGLKNLPESLVKDCQKFSWCCVASATVHNQLENSSLSILKEGEKITRKDEEEKEEEEEEEEDKKSEEKENEDDKWWRIWREEW